MRRSPNPVRDFNNPTGLQPALQTALEGMDVLKAHFEQVVSGQGCPFASIAIHRNRHGEIRDDLSDLLFQDSAAEMFRARDMTLNVFLSFSNVDYHGGQALPVRVLSG